MKLFYSKGACSLAVRIVINELGLDFKYESVDLKTKETETGKDFLKINHKGSVPTIELNNGDILTENLVIQEYLVDANHGDRLLPPLGDFKRYRVLEMSNYITTELHKGFSPIFNKELSDEVKKEIFIPNLLKKFKYLNSVLEKNKFLLGSDFTISDAYLYVMLRWAMAFKFDLSANEALLKYFESLKSRKSIQQSEQEEGIE
jgi:glutathione S-transferase